MILEPIKAFNLLSAGIVYHYRHTDRRGTGAKNVHHHSPLCVHRPNDGAQQVWNLRDTKCDHVIIMPQRDIITI
jgi:hypothetical protein